MSQVHFSSYAGHGVETQKNFNMSQSARIPLSGQIITISGQGGWDRSNTKIASDIAEEMDKAFDNVNHALIDAGGKGMSQVYKLVIYYAPMNDETFQASVDCMKKWFPDHSPLLTAIGIEKLALPEMRVEIEAWAHLP